MTDQDATEGQKRLVKRRIPLVTDAQTAVLAQPTDGSFHNPTIDTQAAPMVGISLRQYGFDSPVNL